jgi:hypothetical protein
MEVLHEMRRVDSDQEVIEGSLEVLAVGAVYLMWDNSYSWSSKKLSYNVELHQPTFTSVDEDRSSLAITNFRSLVIQQPKLARRQKRATRTIQKLTPSVTSLAKQVDEMKILLDFKKKELKFVKSEALEALTELKSGVEKLNGICIR